MIERKPSGIAIVDGAVTDLGAAFLPWSDPATQWGWGVYETIAIRAGAPRHRDEHLSRLTTTASRCDVALPPNPAVVLAIQRVSETVEGGHGWLKILVSGSGHWVVFGGPSDPGDEDRAISAVVLSARRHRNDPLAGMKVTGSAGLRLGLAEAHRRGADEGLWLNERAHLIEACTGNVFVLHGRRVTTPGLADGPLPGITRARAIVALRAMGLTVHEAKVRTTPLRTAREIFLTSSLSGVRPVVRLDGRDVGSGRPGPVALALSQALRTEYAPTEPVTSDGGH